MLSIKNLTATAGAFTLQDINIDVPSGKCHALMGPSGSGKTTLMEALCGLRKITSGTITLNGRNITHLRPAERNIALVPQDNALFPHLTVHQHLTFGPNIQRWSKAETNTRADQLAEKLSITHLINRKPTNLSGGEAKRVALGRALATRPHLLCLDEALTGLDDQTYCETLALLKHIIATEKTTTLHITHNRNEALDLTDSVIELPPQPQSNATPNLTI